MATAPIITSHRGGTFEYDENAVGGFRRALAAGVRGFETDVQFTKDDELVIMHDADISRTTTGQGSVHDLTLAEFTALRMKKSGENAPSVKDLVAVFRGVDGIRVEWEMKEQTDLLGKERGAVYLDKLYSAVTGSQKPGTYVFTSFYQNTLKAMKERHPDAPIGYITGVPMTKKHVDLAVWLGCCNVAPLFEKATPELIEYAHSKGMKVTVWMVKTYEDYLRAVELGADSVTSDYAMRLLTEVSSHR